MGRFISKIFACICMAIGFLAIYIPILILAIILICCFCPFIGMCLIGGFALLLGFG